MSRYVVVEFDDHHGCMEFKQMLGEVVRCKECKWLRYCETEDMELFLDCDHPDGGGIPRNEDWFCADGEREGE